MFILINDKCKMYVPSPSAPLDTRAHWYDGLFAPADGRTRQLTTQLKRAGDRDRLKVTLHPDPFAYLPKVTRVSPPSPSNMTLDKAIGRFDKLLDTSQPHMQNEYYMYFDAAGTAQLRKRMTTGANPNTRFLIFKIMSLLAATRTRPKIRVIVLKRGAPDVTGLACSYTPAGRDMVSRQHKPMSVNVLVPQQALWGDPVNVLLGIAFECYNATNGPLFDATTKLARATTLSCVEQAAWKCIIELDTYIKTSRLYASVLQAGGYISPAEVRHLVAMETRLGNPRGWRLDAYRPSPKTIAGFALSSHNPGLADTSSTTFYGYCGMGMNLGITPKQLINQLKKYHEKSTGARFNFRAFKLWFTTLSGQEFDPWNRAVDDSRLLELLHRLFEGCGRDNSLSDLGELLKGWALPKHVFDAYAEELSGSMYVMIAELTQKGFSVMDDEYWGRFDYQKLDQGALAESFLTCRPGGEVETTLSRHTQAFRNGQTRSQRPIPPRQPKPLSELERAFRRFGK